MVVKTGLEDSDYGCLDALMRPKWPFHIVPTDNGRYLVVDKDSRNCVIGRPPANDFGSEDAAMRWCEVRNLKIERRSVYSD